jgi:diguanylate cyclase (GGDEF)-like protein
MTILTASAGYLPYRVAAIYTTATAIFCAGFYCLMRSRLNRRFSDPSLTIPQLVAAGLVVSYVAYEGPQARPAFMAMYLIAFIFGILGLGWRGLVGVALYFWGCYIGVVLASLWLRPESIEANREVFRIAAFALVLGAMTVLGGYMSRLRQSLRDTNEQLKQALAQSEFLASHDGLTGCTNRRRMMELLALEQRRAERGAPLSLCLMDLDHFKAVNDIHGHRSGDEVLKEFAGTASTRLRPTDFLARYGGEEFVIGLPQTRLVDAIVVAERIRQAVEDYAFSALPPEHHVTVSIGVAEHRGSDTIDSTLSRVDTALYEAKHLGRNRVISAH